MAAAKIQARKRAKKSKPRQAFNYLRHGFVEVVFVSGRGTRADWCEQVVQTKGGDLGATVRYQEPKGGIYKYRHFLTAESFPILYIVDQGKQWLKLGRDPDFEEKLRRAKFKHIRA